MERMMITELDAYKQELKKMLESRLSGKLDSADIDFTLNAMGHFVEGLIRVMREGKSVVTLKRAERTNITVASATLDNSESQQPLRLKVEGDGRYYNFYYAAGDGAWKLLASGVDAVNLSTHQSGGFIGACIGLYATLSNK